MIRAICKEGSVKVDGCYTHDAIPRIVREEDNLKHVIIDFNFLDYLMDFISYCYNPDKAHFEYLFFKYSSEAGYRKNNLEWSYFCYWKKKKCKIDNGRNKKAEIIEDSMVALLFSVLHEIVHIDAEGFGQNAYRTALESVFNEIGSMVWNPETEDGNKE